MKASLMKNRKFSSVICGLVLTGALSSCATPGKDTALGAGGGAAGGALIGGIAGGGKGAAIGAGLGALVGGSIGNYLDKQQQQLKQVADSKRTADGILVNLKNDLLFDTGSSTLKPDAETQLAQLGQILSKYPADKITAKGYTDSTGSKQLNTLLSQQRAEVVAARLRSQGVKENQIVSEGLGPDQPVASNKTATGGDLPRA